MRYRKQMKLKTVIAFLAFVLFLTSCGAKQYRRVEKSGFLGDYSQMREGKFNEALYVYVNPKADCRKYKKVMIEPVTLWAKTEDSPLASLDVKDQEMLVTQGWGMLYDVMNTGQFQITDKPGPDVMLVKGAVTEAVEAKVLIADVLAVVPYVWEAATVWGIGTGKWPFLGELAGELEISDSVTGERLFAGVDKVVGTLGSNLDPRVRWDDVREGFNRWRDHIGTRMTSCHETGSFEMPDDDTNFLQKSIEYLSP